MDASGRNLSPEFRRHFIETFGDDAGRWLDTLPNLLEDCTRRWKLRLQPPFPLSYGYVAPATRQDGAEVVLKARWPNDEAQCEIAALRAFAGDAAVRLLDADPGGAVMLLERIAPGTLLKELPDDREATAIAARIMTALRRPPPRGHAFPTVRDWWRKAAADIRARFGGAGPLPGDLFARAESTFMGADPVGWLLLHGDVHHENILLDSARGWLIIDPQGVIGDPAYEAGTFLANHLLHRPDAPDTLAQRLGPLAEILQIDRPRVIEWSLAQCVLSACWTLESHGQGWERAMTVAQMLADLSG